MPKGVKGARLDRALLIRMFGYITEFHLREPPSNFVALYILSAILPYNLNVVKRFLGGGVIRLA